jgi:hypothetical protein
LHDSGDPLFVALERNAWIDGYEVPSPIHVACLDRVENRTFSHSVPPRMIMLVWLTKLIDDRRKCNS